MVEQVLVDNTPVPSQGSITVPAGHNKLEFRYTGLSFSAPRNVRFKFQLAGFDGSWVDAGSQRIAYYTNVPPGRYRFRVIASNGEGIWNQEGASVDIELQPHFYQTLWFYTLSGLGLLAAAIGGHRLRIRQISVHEKELEWHVKQRTEELQNEVIVRKRAEEDAEAGSRAKSMFLANMSHEIRTPINGVLGMTELALETQLTTEQREFLGMVKSSGEALLTVLNDVLDFSKIEAGRLDLDPIRFRLRDSLDDTLKLLALRADEKDLELICDVRPEVPEVVVADPSRLRQIIINLVGNAIKFTPRGEVGLEVALESRSSDQARLHFTVRDTGIGIAPEKQKIIFEAFSQADGSTTRTFGGTGLGLTISLRLVNMMAGRMWVESELGKGSRFHFTVQVGTVKETVTSGPAEPVRLAGLPAPVTEAKSSAPASKPRAEQATGTKSEGYGVQDGFEARRSEVRDARPSLHILLAEDNLVNQMLASRLLEKQGHTVVVAGNGRKVLEALEKQRFDLVFMDVSMPEMDGFEAVAAIRAEEATTGSHIPVIAMTAHAMKGDRERCLAAGMDAYISKPIQPNELSHIIKTLSPAPVEHPVAD